jgi:hypothetical protein
MTPTKAMTNISPSGGTALLTRNQTPSTTIKRSIIHEPRKLPDTPAQNMNAKRSLQQSHGNEAAATTRANSPGVIDKEARKQQLHELILSACKVTGTRRRELANRILIQVADALVRPKSTDAEDDLITAISAIAEMEPQNLTEAMLATQMIAANDAALMFLSRATNKDQHPEAIDTNVLRATRLMRVFREQLEAMQKLKGKSGQQSVRVEHVHVHDGGQAIVGTVTSSGTGRGVGDDAGNQ